MEPAAALAGVDHAVPVGAGRYVFPGRERRRTLLDRDIRSEEPQGVGVHGKRFPAAFLENLGDRPTMASRPRVTSPCSSST